MIGDEGIPGGIFAVDATDVHWTEYPGNWPGVEQIMRTPLSGAPTTVFASGLWAPRSLTVDGGYLYWTEFRDTEDVPISPASGGVFRAPLGGGARESLYTGHDITELSLDDSTLYFVYQGPGSGSGETSEIRRMPKAGGAYPVVVKPPSGAGSLVVDAAHVYWTTTIGMTVSRADKVGGPEIILAKTDGTPYAMAQDEAALYWVDPGNGTVMKLAK